MVGKFKGPVVAVAFVAALSALGLFLVRSCLNDARNLLADTRAGRDHAWGQYLLSEQRGTAADILIAAHDPFGIARVVPHMRGVFLAISAAADEDISTDAFRLLGMDGPPHKSPFALDLAAGQYGVYNRLQEELEPFQGKALHKIEAYRSEINRLERRIGYLTNLETVMFLLTVFCALLINIFGARREG